MGCIAQPVPVQLAALFMLSEVPVDPKLLQFDITFRLLRKYPNYILFGKMEGAIPLVETAHANGDAAFTEDQPECLSRDELRRRMHNLDAQQVRFQTRYPQEEKLTGNFKASRPWDNK